MGLQRLSLVLTASFAISVSPAQEKILKPDPLAYAFDKHYGQVEVGGRYAGAEFHGSRPLPSRISFYYPVANSIDLSTDYWKRGESQPMAVGVQVDDAEKRWLGREPWSYVVSPHKVVFHREEKGVAYEMKYEFCLGEPAMIFSFMLKNISSRKRNATVYTHLKPALRTCQTYARRDSAKATISESLNLMQFDFDNADVDSAVVFVQNNGIAPSGWLSDAAALSVTDSGTSSWVNSAGMLSKELNGIVKHRVVAAFEYRQEVMPGDSIVIVQGIGSCKQGEAKGIAQRLSKTWSKEVGAYNNFVTHKSEDESKFVTGDPILDESAIWAKALLTTNAHYINNTIVPMPCPAEYNFFFSHDVLMTDLAAVYFDLPRVKKDLQYIASLAKDNIIPHAYYWRDDGFKTEYCTPDNWNHFWFILTSGSYLRHSLDEQTLHALYPLLTKSLQELLTQVKSDHLMYAFRPDWWDLGHIEGPRSYTTILAIRSLREYLFISSFLKEHSTKLPEYELLADSMQVALTEKLWDGKMQYLTNYNAGKKDEHYYMGSLLAGAFDLLDANKTGQLLQTASRTLLDPNLGVRTVMPPDFHTKEAIDFYKFAGEEAGRPYFYINGGVWPHDNSWYAIALNHAGKSDEALQFVKNTMTLDGVVHSPMGQPAMYEYRYADSTSPQYGMIDKPSFLWAGGFYLKTLYGLFGARENEWNLSFDGSLPSASSSASYTFTLGGPKEAQISAAGKYLESLTSGGHSIPSVVLPVDNIKSATTIEVKFGKSHGVYLKSINAIVEKVSMDASEGLSCDLLSFQGHKISAIVISPKALQTVEVDGQKVSDIHKIITPDGLEAYDLRFIGSDQAQHLRIHY